MNQNFTVEYDGVDITSKIATVDVTELVNRMYNVCTIICETSLIDNRDITIFFGGKVFTGFVYSSSQTAVNKFSIVCRTNTAKLTSPFSPKIDKYYNATTSHNLFSEISIETGIIVSSTCVDLDFGGSYHRKDTALNEIKKVAAVTGAEYYVRDGLVYIDPNKSINEDGKVIELDEIFNFVPESKMVKSNGVGIVTITNSSENLEGITKNKIYAEIDECTGEIFVFTTPVGDIEQYSGIRSLRSAIVVRDEKSSILDKSVIKLKCPIETVQEVKLNGVIITDYTYSYQSNYISLSNIERGQVEIKYTAETKKGYVNTTKTPVGNFIDLNIFYLDQVLKFEGFKSKSCNNETNGDDDIQCEIPSDLLYQKGFEFYIHGGNPEIIFYENGNEILVNNTNVFGDNPIIEEAKLEVDGTAYKYRTKYKSSGGETARSGEITIPFTIETVDGDTYFKFADYYPDVTIVYNTQCLRVEVKDTGISYKEITMTVKNIDTGKFCEYKLKGPDAGDLDTIPCLYPAKILVDTKKEIDINFRFTQNASVSYSTNHGTTGTLVTDNFGILTVTAYEDTIFQIDAQNIKARNVITVIANVNGSLDNV